MAIYTIQLKRGKSASWLALNPILQPGEPGFEIDTGKLKIGNGIDTWVDLKYLDEDKELVVTANTRSDFPVIGDVNIIYKASQEKQLYQWNEDAYDYELIIDTNIYATKQELQEAIANMEIPEVILEEYATKAYTQELFNKMVALTHSEILEICQ